MFARFGRREVWTIRMISEVRRANRPSEKHANVGKSVSVTTRHFHLDLEIQMQTKDTLTILDGDSDAREKPDGSDGTIARYLIEGPKWIAVSVTLRPQECCIRHPLGNSATTGCSGLRSCRTSSVPKGSRCVQSGFASSSQN